MNTSFVYPVKLLCTEILKMYNIDFNEFISFFSISNCLVKHVSGKK